MVTITENEIINTVKKLLNEILDFPEAKIDNLFQVASILLAIGLCKNSPSFKLLADHVVVFPSRFKPVLAYSYQLTGVAGELREKYVQLIERGKQQLREAILNALQTISEPMINENHVLQKVDKIRTIYESLPTITRERE
jgi:hypothetical protein